MIERFPFEKGRSIDSGADVFFLRTAFFVYSLWWNVFGSKRDNGWNACDRISYSANNLSTPPCMILSLRFGVIANRIQAFDPTKKKIDFVVLAARASPIGIKIQPSN